MADETSRRRLLGAAAALGATSGCVSRARSVVNRSAPHQVSLTVKPLPADAAPAASPLAGTGWTAPSLRWEMEDPSVPFFGSDGELDVVAAREAFRAAGYNYDDQGNLLAR